MTDLHSYSLARLREAARRLRVEGVSRLRKPDLVQRLAHRLGEVKALLSRRGLAQPQEVQPRRLPPELKRLPGEEELAGLRELPHPAERPQSGRLEVRMGVSAATAVERLPRERSTPDLEQPPRMISSGAGLRAPVPLEVPEEPPLDLPWAYEDDRVLLLVRDPRTLFAYWDFHPETVRRAMEGLADPVVRLRLYQLGGSEPALVRDLDVSVESRSWYLYDCEPNSDYRLELVVVGKSGAERLLGRGSNVATLPPNQPSAWVEDRFASLPLDVPLSSAALFTLGRLSGDADRRLHIRAFELSGGGPITGDQASSSTQIVEGFGGRSWSGTLVRK